MLPRLRMTTRIALSALVLGLTFAALPAGAQDRDQTPKPGAQTPESTTKPEPSASPQTGGDTKPSAVDPAESTKTGANAGEGASYNRSQEKGDSTLPKDAGDKSK